MKMLNQTIFNRTTIHLLKQGVPGTRIHAPDGTKNVVGSLIPDTMYVPAMEGMTTEDLIEYYPGFRRLLRKSNNLTAAKDMLFKVESIHKKFKPGAWKEQFVLLAKSLSVNTNMINKLSIKGYSSPGNGAELANDWKEMKYKNIWFSPSLNLCWHRLIGSTRSRELAEVTGWLKSFKLEVVDEGATVS